MTERHQLPEPECSHADMRDLRDVSICGACGLSIPALPHEEGLSAARAAIARAKENKR